MRITDVRINGIKNPVGFAYPLLKCSWKVIDTRSKMQKRAKIEVSLTEHFEDILYIKESDYLDSIGEALLIDCQPKTRYYYRIEVVTAEGEVAVSETAVFETGKMNEPWSADWIGTREEDHFHPMFRKEFNLENPVKSARLYISGLGMYEVSINNIKAGDEYLTPLVELQAVAGDSACFRYAQGYELGNDDVSTGLLQEARETAVNADAAVLFLGLPDQYESEGYDRTHLSLPASHIALIESVAEVQENIIVVLSNGSPLERPWISRTKAVLEGYLGGQAFGGAVADLLFGVGSPSGKLAETFPVKLSDNPSFLNFPGEGDKVEYKEGLFVGYRYYDKKELEPLFPFGFGLSYTEFEYSGLKLDKASMSDNETVQVSVTVKNAGSRAGQEIVQLYVGAVESTVIRPLQELKDFLKVQLQPGEVREISFMLSKRAFAYYNVELGDWHVETGTFRIAIGASSRDIRLSTSLIVASTAEITASFHRNTTVGDLLENPITAMFAKKFSGIFGLEDAMEDNPEMHLAMMEYMPLRALIAFGQGKYTEEDLRIDLRQLNDLV